MVSEAPVAGVLSLLPLHIQVVICPGCFWFSMVIGLLLNSSQNCSVFNVDPVVSMEHEHFPCAWNTTLLPRRVIELNWFLVLF